jgi:parallel beta-helix repeat protein
VSDSQFTGGNTGVLLGNGSNVTVTHNTFQNVLSASIDAGAGSSANIVENFFNASLSGTVYGVFLGDFSAGSNVTGNTFSGGLVSLSLKNTTNNTITNNTFYSPYTHAITVVEDGNVPLGTTNNNTISNNTLLTWEPNSSMIRIDDQSDAVGTLATLSANTYLNVYR